MAEYQAGRFAEAKSLLDRIVAHDDAPPIAWVHRAGVCEHLGDKHQTLNAWNDAAAHLPEQMAICERQADALRECGQLDDALHAYTRCTELEPDNAAAWMNLGAMLRLLDRHRDAVSPLRRAVEIEPKMTAAHAALIRSCLATKSVSEAMTQCRLLLETTPNDAQAHLLAAQTLVSAGELSLALNHLRIARQLAPEQAEIELTYATTLVDAGAYDDARHVLEQFMAEHPAELSAPLILLSLDRRLGRHDEGTSLAEQLLEKHGNVAEVRIAAAQTLVAAKSPDRIPELLNSIVDHPQLTRPLRRTANFTLAAALDQLNRYEDAWSHYETANALAEVHFDPDRHRNIFHHVRTTCTRQTLSARANVHDDAPRPVFILGMPRSGTSLLEQMLDLHPNVAGAGELSLLGRMIGRLPGLTGRDGTYPDILMDLSQDTLDSIASWGREELQAATNGGAPVITEKTPTSFLQLAIAQLAFPDARVIVCSRHPEHVCLSCYFHEFVGQHPYQYNLEHLAFYTNLQRAYIDHWSNELDLPMHVIDYATLVQDPENELRSLLEMLDLPWHDGCLRVESNTRAVRTASAQQVREPIHDRAMTRYAPYEPYLAPLRDALDRHRFNG